MELNSPQPTLSNDLGNTKVEYFEFIPSQNEVEKLLNDLERNDQILLLRCLGVREITIQNLLSLSSNNNNPKQTLLSFLKEWDFFQTPMQTITCIRRIYHAQHQNEQEIPLKFFNALTIDRFTLKLKLILSKSLIEELCKQFEIKTFASFDDFLKQIEEIHPFQSLDNIREFDTLLSEQVSNVDSLRTLIAEALSIYCGDKSYLSITPKYPSKTNAEILGVFYHYFGENIPSEFGLFDNQEGSERKLTSVMKWPALSSGNCGWEKDLTKLNDFGVELKINLDIPSQNIRQIEIKKQLTILKVMSKCSEWHFEKDSKKKSLLWSNLERVVSDFLSFRIPERSLTSDVETWIRGEMNEKIQHWICDFLDLDPETKKIVQAEYILQNFRVRYLSHDHYVLGMLDLLELKTKKDDETGQFVSDGIRKIVLGGLQL